MDAGITTRSWVAQNVCDIGVPLYLNELLLRVIISHSIPRCWSLALEGGMGVERNPGRYQRKSCGLGTHVTPLSKLCLLRCIAARHTPIPLLSCLYKIQVTFSIVACFNIQPPYYHSTGTIPTPFIIVAHSVFTTSQQSQPYSVSSHSLKKI